MHFARLYSQGLPVGGLTESEGCCVLGKVTGLSLLPQGAWVWMPAPHLQTMILPPLVKMMISPSSHSPDISPPSESALLISHSRARACSVVSVCRSMFRNQNLTKYLAQPKLSPPCSLSRSRKAHLSNVSNLIRIARQCSCGMLTLIMKGKNYPLAVQGTDDHMITFFYPTSHNSLDN